MAHGKLLRYLDGELGDFMAGDWLGRDVTPRQLWDSNKTLILTYSHDPSSAYNDKIWSEVRHAWGDKKRPEALFRFLNSKKRPAFVKKLEFDSPWFCLFLGSMTRHQTAKYPWAAMAHLTPSALDVIMNPNGGIAQLSDGIARQVKKSSFLFSFTLKI